MGVPVKAGEDIFEDLKIMLEYYQALGIDSIGVDLPDIKISQPRAAAKSSSAGKGKELHRRKDHARSAEEKQRMLAALRDEIGDCTRCKLSKHRTNIVFGEGGPAARLMFVGEGPGQNEDIQGRPFVGEAGLLLTKLIEKMGFKREDVYIANIVKCRPPMNRDPEADEVATCRGFLEKQIEIISPEVIMTLGRIALRSLFEKPELNITAVRGKFIDFKGIHVMPTFHPAYLLRNPGDKWKTWSDAQKVIARLNNE